MVTRLRTHVKSCFVFYRLKKKPAFIFVFVLGACFSTHKMLRNSQAIGNAKKILVSYKCGDISKKRKPHISKSPRR